MVISYSSLIEDQTLPLRYVIFHLHPVSARLRFLLGPNGHIVFPKPLPSLSDVFDDIPTTSKTDNLHAHPSQYLNSICDYLDVRNNVLSVVPDFHINVDTPDILMAVHWLRVTSEQPFDAPKNHHWIELPDCFRLIENERILMKKLYGFYLD